MYLIFCNFHINSYILFLGGCPEADGYVNMMNKCFYIENNPLNYAEAKANCQNKEGRLFEPRDLSTNDQVIGAALVISPSTRQTSDFWIGMNDISTEGTFQYTSTGGDLAFTDWSYNEPNDSQVMTFLRVLHLLPSLSHYFFKYSRVPNKRTGRLLENEKKKTPPIRSYSELYYY